jgi:ferrochelatase
VSQKIAVVLFQLGGPDSLEAVEPFLFNLFSDPDIFDFPGSSVLGKPLARFISRNRKAHAQEHYAAIGGKSPILDLTMQQSEALEAELRSHGLDATTMVAMRYWHPMTSEAVQKVKEGSFDRVILLPLYQQFSKSTTFSSLNAWNIEAQKANLEIPTQLICCYPNHPLLVDAYISRIQEAYAKFEGLEDDDIDLVFSAHGVPLSYIRRGDPYQLQVEETFRSVTAKGNWKSPATLCYQSKVGPQKWLSPSLTDTVERLIRGGRKNLLIVPIAFVTEHIETLHEIDIELREEAEIWGLEQMHVMPGLNDHPTFIQCLSEQVQARIHSSSDPTSRCMQLREQAEGHRTQPTLCPWYTSTQ